MLTHAPPFSQSVEIFFSLDLNGVVSVKEEMAVGLSAKEEERRRRRGKRRRRSLRRKRRGGEERGRGGGGG